MKLKKLILLVPMLVSLAACGGSKKDFTGTYSFQLGSTDGTHTGINLTLTDEPEDVEIESGAQAKKFSLEFNIKGKGQSGGTSFFSIIEEFSDVIKEYTPVEIGEANETSESTSGDTSDSSEEGLPTTIEGYYYVKEVEVKEANGKVSKENRLSMGVEVLDGIDIGPEIVEKILYAYINDDTLNVVIPVSVTDFLYQLYWYGYRISSLDELLDPTDLKEESHGILKHNDIGTHPTEDDIEDIKGYQSLRKDTASDYHIAEAFFLDYRDFHTLNMGLVKNGK